MRTKSVWEAIIAIRGCRILRLEFYGKPDPYVRIYITTPKGKSTVTVPTNCRTRTLKNIMSPVWNETFAVPVIRETELLVFKVMDSREPLVDGFVGLCLLPVSKLPDDGTVWQGRLQIFNPDKASRDGTSEIGGSLDIAAKVVATELSLLEKEDLLGSERRKNCRRPLEHRFLGIGELAAFYLDEGFSNDVDANWDHAVRILSEQLAYRKWEETNCIDDVKNYSEAKAQILKDGGLWDGH